LNILVIIVNYSVTTTCVILIRPSGVQKSGDARGDCLIVCPPTKI